ncbi:restriction endonuclease subunit S [Streptococcus suis]
MKDSGIEWIGEVPEEWGLKPIKYLVSTPVTDGPHETPTLYDEGIPFLSAESVKNGILDSRYKRGYISETAHKIFSRKVSPQKNDIFIVKSGATTGNVGIVTTDEIFDIWSPLALVRTRSDLANQKFVYYFMLSDAFTKQIQNKWSFGTQQNIGMGVIEKIKLVVPPLDEQTQIANFLDKKVAQLDSVKSLLEEQVKTLEDYRQSLIYETVTKGLDKTVPLKESGVDWIGQIPEGWGVKRLKNILSDEKDNMKVGPFGSALSGNDIKSLGKKWVYNQRTVLDNNFITTDSFIDDTKWEELKSFSVKAGDVLLTTRGTIGKIAIVPENNQVGIIHPCLIRFRLNEGMLSGELLKYIFNDTDLVKNQLHYLSNSTTIDVIYSYNLKNIFLPVIPESVQNKITDFLKREIARINQMIAIKKEQIENINKQRQTLIYDVVTGKRRV